MCNCVSCKYTDGFRDTGFAAWPRGNPKTPGKARAEYSAHVSYGLRGGVVRAIQPINPDPVSFYGVPAGSTRTAVTAVLRATFEDVAVPEDTAA